MTNGLDIEKLMRAKEKLNSAGAKSHALQIVDTPSSRAVLRDFKKYCEEEWKKDT